MSKVGKALLLTFDVAIQRSHASRDAVGFISQPIELIFAFHRPIGVD